MMSHANLGNALENQAIKSKFSSHLNLNPAANNKGLAMAHSSIFD